MPLIRTRNAVFALGAVLALTAPADIGRAETASQSPIMLAQFRQPQGPGQQPQQQEEEERRRRQQQQQRGGGGGGGGDDGRRSGQPGGGGFGGRPPQQDDGQNRRRGGDDNQPRFGQQPGGGFGGRPPQDDDQNRRRGGDDNQERRRGGPGDDPRPRPNLNLGQPGGGAPKPPGYEDPNRRSGGGAPKPPGYEDPNRRPGGGAPKPPGYEDPDRRLGGGSPKPPQADERDRRRDGPGRGDDNDRQRPSWGQRPGGVGEAPDGARRFEAFRPRLDAEDIRRRREERREIGRERLQDIVKQRRERKDDAGRTIIEEGDNRRIYRGEGGRAFIRHDEAARFRGVGRNYREERGPGGERRHIVIREGGIRIVTVVDDDGKLVRRYRQGADGREYVLIDNRERRRHRRGERRDRGGFGFYIDLAPPIIRIPRERYYVYADRASEEEIEDTLSAPPVEDMEPEYSLDEIRASPRLRERMPSVNLNTITFDSGSWEITEDQIGKLEVMARAIERILRRNPDEVFMIEGHTDAVGSDEDNLTLSDRRAESVARVLSDEFNIPAENLVTQGYGEQYLLVDTQSDERGNRRVEFRRITPLLARGEEQ